MNQAKKLIVYVVLNVIVSAVTILCVLYLWETTRLKNLLIDRGPVAEVSQPDTASEQPADSPKLLIEIGEVGGVGNLSTEYVRLVRPESSEAETISLQKWRIKNENNHNFSILEQSGLASLELHRQGAVNIYSKSGTSNPIELYLGLSDPLWQPGETVTLIDPQGEVHDTYLIP